MIQFTELANRYDNYEFEVEYSDRLLLRPRPVNNGAPRRFITISLKPRARNEFVAGLSSLYDLGGAGVYRVRAKRGVFLAGRSEQVTSEWTEFTVLDRSASPKRSASDSAELSVTPASTRVRRGVGFGVYLKLRNITSEPIEVDLVGGTSEYFTQVQGPAGRTLPILQGGAELVERWLRGFPRKWWRLDGKDEITELLHLSDRHDFSETGLYRVIVSRVLLDRAGVETEVVADPVEVTVVD